MIKHFLTVAFRLLKRTGISFSVNLLGLSLGLAVSIIAYLFVCYEFSYDKFHQNHDRIYRLERTSSVYGEGVRQANAPNYVASRLTDFDEVEAVGRIGSWRSSTVRVGEILHKEDNLKYANGDLFNVFSFDVLEGDPVTGLEQPWAIVITESIKNLYFPDRNALGEVMEVDTSSFEVVGVIKEYPGNSHVHFDFIISLATMNARRDLPEEVVHFGSYQPTYILLADWVDVEAFESRLLDFAHMCEPEFLDNRREEVRTFIRPIKEIHLARDISGNIESPGNPTMVYLMAIIGFLVLLTACFNFMNLSTARAVSRSKEVGVKKTFGASRQTIRKQFLFEAFITSFLAGILAILLAVLLIPALNRISDLSLTVPFTDPIFWVFVLGTILFTSILAGSWPAFFLSSFNPSLILKGGANSVHQGIVLRKILIVAQYFISICLIIGTILVIKQLSFLKTQALGTNIENKLVLELPDGKVGPSSYEFVKERFGDHSGIVGTTISSSVPGRWRYYWRMPLRYDNDTDNRMVRCFQADYDYITTYQLEMIAGEPFDKEMSSEFNRGFIINEAALREFGWNSPEHAMTESEYSRRRIHGVFKDYHFKGMNELIEPMGMFLITEDYRYLTMLYREGMEADVLAHAKEVHDELFPDAAIDYFFLKDDFNKQYVKEESTGKLVTIFTFLAILIAIIGLYGMSVFILVRRRKEIAIRKVNGALHRHIYAIISMDFIIWIGFAYALALPLMIWIGLKWLEDYPYRTEMSWWIFAISALITLAVTFITISAQTIRAVRITPAESLRAD